jgi:sulfite reductase alpha subunit-like flavoprotein
MQTYILYGSQKGTSEYISNQLKERLTQRICHNTLNSVVNDISELNQKTNTIFIICSTTGNGEAPENSFKFWKTIKSRALPKTLFENIQYAVLALGDSNYSQFCNAGKQIDKRFTELGATRIQPVCCADDAQDMEETVNEWITTIADHLNQ